MKLNYKVTAYRLQVLNVFFIAPKFLSDEWFSEVWGISISKRKTFPTPPIFFPIKNMENRQVISFFRTLFDKCKASPALHKNFSDFLLSLNQEECLILKTRVLDKKRYHEFKKMVEYIVKNPKEYKTHKLLMVLICLGKSVECELSGIVVRRKPKSDYASQRSKCLKYTFTRKYFSLHNNRSLFINHNLPLFTILYTSEYKRSCFKLYQDENNNCLSEDVTLFFERHIEKALKSDQMELLHSFYKRFQASNIGVKDAFLLDIISVFDKTIDRLSITLFIDKVSPLLPLVLKKTVNISNSEIGSLIMTGLGKAIIIQDKYTLAMRVDKYLSAAVNFLEDNYTSDIISDEKKSDIRLCALWRRSEYRIISQ